MKSLALALVSMAGYDHGLAKARILAPKGATVPVLDFSDLSIKWVEQSERGPTISGHFMVHVNSALFDAYAAFVDGTTCAITNLDNVRIPAGTFPSKATEDAQSIAMVDAAYTVITTLGEMLLDQEYLEIENGVNADTHPK